MLQERLDCLEVPEVIWNDQPDPAELAALEDIEREGWFDTDEPIVVGLLELVEAISSVSNTENEALATLAHMLQSGSVVLAGDEKRLSGPLH